MNSFLWADISSQCPNRTIKDTHAARQQLTTHSSIDVRHKNYYFHLHSFIKNNRSNKNLIKTIIIIH